MLHTIHTGRRVRWGLDRNIRQFVVERYGVESTKGVRKTGYQREQAGTSWINLNCRTVLLFEFLFNKLFRQAIFYNKVFFLPLDKSITLLNVLPTPHPSLPHFGLPFFLPTFFSVSITT